MLLVIEKCCVSPAFEWHANIKSSSHKYCYGYVIVLFIDDCLLPIPRRSSFQDSLGILKRTPHQAFHHVHLYRAVTDSIQLHSIMLSAVKELTMR